MDIFINRISIVVVTLLALYAIFYFLYCKLELQVDSTISTEAMPALKPVPIPTKHQKTIFHKLVVFIFEVRQWEVVENWHYQLNADVELIIPKGFRFDGASIPRPFWAILSPIGLLLIPGLLHDYDYAYEYDQIWRLDANGKVVAYEKGAGKEFWDGLFMKVGKEVNGMVLINLIAWLAVFFGGNSTWEKYRQQQAVADKPK
jgi:hypothetical protein